MNAKSASIAALLAAFAATACTVDSAPQSDENVDSQSSAIIGGATGGVTGGTATTGGVTGGTGGTGGVQPLPVDPTPNPPPATPGYAAQGSLVRITSDELDTLLVALLRDSKIVVDTLATSPTVWAEYDYCTYPNKEIRDAMIADCLTLPSKSAQLICRRQVNIDYPNTHECGTTNAQYHSYLDFGPPAEFAGAKDVGIEMKQIYRDSWGPGSVYLDLNNIRGTVGYTTTRAWFTPEPDYHGAVNFSLKLDSNQPTITCRHTVIPCPDIELTNMLLSASLSGIKPVDGDTTKLGFDHVDATFTFDRNLNNIPDDFVTLFLDVDALIKKNVQGQVKKALERTASRKALSQALTELATRKAREHNGSRGIVRFYGAFGQSDGSMMVDYQPCPANGCGVAGPGGPILSK